MSGSKGQPPTDEPPVFDRAFQERLIDLFVWRRDVRRFKPDPVVPAEIDRLLEAANLAPSVGLSQPWRFVLVEDGKRRRAVRDNFEKCNAAALAAQDGGDATLYAGLKLAGLDDAPVHLAVFCDEGTEQGRGLGRATMPEMLRYSVVAAVQNLWLAARSRGVGVGWVSILEPEEIVRILEVPSEWRLVAYLCIGYPHEEQIDPELERRRWERRREIDEMVTRR
jgi:5,6-dimethylbenzimidazole synthase